MSVIKAGTTLTTAYTVEADTTGALEFKTGPSATLAMSISSSGVVSLDVVSATVLQSSSATITNLIATSSTVTNLLATSLTVNSNNISAENSLGFRNRIINGDMRIAQRGTSAVIGSGGYPVDRFLTALDNDGAVSVQQDSSAPAGFVNSVKWTTTTADGSLSASQFTQFRQPIEGTNVADLGFGTASAKTVTLSFWVRSSLTGTFAGSLRNGGADRSYVFTYTISVADTWEYKTITIPGDTTGTWLTTTGIGMFVSFDLGTGTTFQNTAGSWASGNYWSTSGAVSVIGTLNATWYITGVQLEAGSVATPFERRSITTELQFCQRYCYVIRGNAATPVVIANGWWDGATGNRSTCIFPVTMRSVPTLFFSAAGDLEALQVNVNWNACSAAALTSEVSIYNAPLSCTSSGGTTGDSSALRLASGATKHIGFSAEL